jgi:hypothetical protein
MSNRKRYSMPPEWQGRRGVRRLRNWERRPRQLSLDTFLAVYRRTASRLTSSDRRWRTITAEEDAYASREAWRFATGAACWDGFPDYETLRRLIYRRDRGRCWRCCRVVPWCQYNLGHIIDARLGGSMMSSNLAVMCKHCNVNKPWHRTRDFIQFAEFRCACNLQYQDRPSKLLLQRLCAATQLPGGLIMPRADTAPALGRFVAINVRLDPEIHGLLKAEADAEARTPTDLARKYILAGLKRLPERPARSERG